MTKTVCIVSDQPGLLKMMCYALKMQGLEVLEANNDYEALNILVNHHVDMVVADWQMSSTDGLNFVQRLRQAEVCMNLPVVVISCRDDFMARREALALGVISWLTKPFRLSELQVIVGRSLELTSLPSSQNFQPTGAGRV